MSQEDTEFKSRRRTKAQYGFVNFPVDDPRLRSTGEGGMFVKLVVIDDRDYGDSDWNICCGAGVTDLLSESFIGDDQAETPQLDFSNRDESPEQTLEAMKAHDTAYKAWQGRHFPFAADDSESGERRFLSRTYVAAMVIGITGWSGFDDATERYWQCRRDDLTAEGNAFVAQMEQLYRGCTIHLLTFLDT